MKTLEESKKARVLEKIRKIPLPLSDEGYRKLAWIPFEDLPKEYQDETNRIVRERNKAYQAKLARGEVKVPF
ncbi:MAG: hypothetical protein IJI37_04530 [Opitutales bacterium]|nr:hypothetical protein [Opitutales bacterium]